MSIPYDAAVQLACDVSTNPYPINNIRCNTQPMPLHKSRPSIPFSPYNATACLMYAASDCLMPYEQFKVKYDANAVEFIKYKSPMDLSIPYSPLLLIWTMPSAKSMSYEKLIVKYKANAIACVKAKCP